MADHQRTKAASVAADISKGIERAREDNSIFEASVPCVELFRAIIQHASEEGTNIEAELKAQDISRPSKAQRVGMLIDLVLDISLKCGHPLRMLNGSPSYYNGKYWEIVQNEDLGYFMAKAAQALGMDHFEAMFCDLVKKAIETFQIATRADLAKREPGVALINFANGTLEVRADGARLRDHSPKDGLRYCVSFNYDKNATAPRFLEYLEGWLPDEADRRNVQEYCGSIFTDLNHEKLMYFYGATGSNGKTTLKDIICGTLGNSRISNESLEHLTAEGGTGETARAALEGNLLNACGEVDHEIKSSAILKALASRERISVRPPYAKQTHVIPAHSYARLLFCCNSLPTFVKGASEPEKRRFLFIEFRNRIPVGERNGNLAREIVAAEQAGIFNWMLEGLYRMQDNAAQGLGFFTPNEHAEAVAQTFLEGSNSVIAYLSEYGIKPNTPANRQRYEGMEIEVKLGQLFSNEGYDILRTLHIPEGELPSYTSFCAANLNKPKGKKNFWAALEQLGFKRKRYKDTGEFVQLLILTDEERLREQARHGE